MSSELPLGPAVHGSDWATRKYFYKKNFFALQFWSKELKEFRYKFRHFVLISCNGKVNSCLLASVETPSHLLLDIDPLFLCYDQSGSQGNLCDSWQEDVTPDGAAGGAERRQKLSTSKIRAMPAEYPFQANLGLPQNSINFDLTHKRGKVGPWDHITSIK